MIEEETAIPPEKIAGTVDSWSWMDRAARPYERYL
jgi:hypothetical protein